MSFFPGKDPKAGDTYACDAIAQVIVPRTVDLGDFEVRRALPSARTRMVGPFIFFDHFGPAEFRGGNGLDVRPHPHIGLATVTYLFDGEIMHRDSLGTAHADPPGRGELDDGRARHRAFRAHAAGAARRRRADPWIAMWVALPAAKRRDRTRASRITRRPNSRRSWSRARMRALSLARSWRRLAGTGRARDSVRRCAARTPARGSRSMPITRSARSISSPAKSRLRAIVSPPAASWCSSPATP